jgi:hypothetical protein
MDWSLATNEICYSSRRRDTTHVKFPLPTLEYLLTNRLNG